MAIPYRKLNPRRPARRSGPTFGRRARFPLFLVLLLATIVPLSRAAPLELDFPLFAGGYGTKFYAESAREFEKQRPDIKVKVYGDPRIMDQVRVRIFDGNPPDATLPFHLNLPALIRARQVIDLAPYLDGPNWEGDARWRDTFLPGALDSWKVGESIYGVPLSYACWTIFYNKGLFRARGWTVPKTWDEFFALCDKIKASGIAPVSLTGVYGNYPDAFLRGAYYNLAGAQTWRKLNDLEPGAWTDPKMVRAAEVLQRVTQQYTLSGWEGATHTAAQLAFMQGRAAMTVSGSWMISEMAGKIPDDLEIGVMSFPMFPDGVSDPTTIQTGADSFFVFATGDEKRIRATVDFLRFLTSRTRAEAFVRRMDSPVALRGVPEEAFSPRMRETARMIGAAKESFNMPQEIMRPPTMRQALIDGRSRLMTARFTPQQFAERVEAAAANDRMRAADPTKVEYRHPKKAAALLASLAGIAALLVWLKVGAAVPSRPGLPGALQPKAREDTRLQHGESYFGRLRATVGLGFVGPAFLVYGALVLVPSFAAVGWAFTRWDGLTPRTWGGLFNFKWLIFESDIFWNALKNNFFLMGVPAVTVLPLALLFAYLLHRGVWGAKVFRAVFLFPNLLGGITATLLWLSAYEPHGGLANAALVGLGNLLDVDWLRSFDGYPWLAQRNLYSSLVPIYIWMACGFNLILYLAAMEGIDPQLYEAAELDGASRARQFFMITLPLIWEVVVISGVFIVIGGLNAFEMIWLLTQQDPDSTTHTLGTLMVTSMFKEFQIGRATAIAVVLFTLVFAGSALLTRVLKREAVE
jgi:ABC-type sugar transport system permease subunit/ABC-type glycerol-3-phosphate transport system substrate-binding protein